VRLDSRETTVTLNREGGAKLSHGGEAEHAILADDSAILAEVSETQRDRLLVVQPALALLTAPSRKPQPVFIDYPDRGLTLQQRGPGGVAALVTGDPATAHPRLGASIDPAEPLARAGEMQFTTFGALDGAPLLGTLRASKANLVAGFGLTGAFLAPAIARAIAGQSTGEEAGWFAARGSARPARLTAAEYVPVPV
jgi:hypothetical protein